MGGRPRTQVRIAASDDIDVIGLTALSMLGILFVHHYEFGLYGVPDAIGSVISYGSVAMMFFLSGYKLAKRYVSLSPVSFLKTRFVRIMPLYLLVLPFHALLIEHPPFSLTSLLLHAFPVAALFPAAADRMYLTLYFIPLLWTCYLLFLAVRRFLSSPLAFAAVTLLFVGSIAFVREYAVPHGWLMHIRFFIHMPLFVAGMAWARWARPLVWRSAKLLSVAAAAVLVTAAILQAGMLGTVNAYAEPSVSHLLLMPAVIFLAWGASPSRSVFAHPVRTIGYASFVMFLIHSIVWKLFRLASVAWIPASALQWAVTNVVGFAVILWISTAVQHAYDTRLAPRLRRMVGLQPMERR